MSITRRALMIAGGVAGGGLVLGVATMGAWIATYDRRAEQREQLAERGAKRGHAGRTKVIEAVRRVALNARKCKKWVKF